MKYKHSVRLAVAAAITGGFISSQASAAGFALIENSASGMGNAYAGAAAIAEDASTVWFNPAGMTRLNGTQIVVAGHIISPAADFTDTASTNAFGGGLNGNADDGGVTALVPNFYYVTDIGGDARFGIGITVPFGLSTEYDDDWIGRYGATTSEVQAINFNPSFAYKHNDKVSVGLGLSLQYIEAKLENKIDSHMTCVGLRGQFLSEDALTASGNCTGLGLTGPANADQDSAQSLEGDNWNWGWNIGVLYEIDDASRLGIAYRSSMDANLEGDVDFTVDPTLQGFIDAAFGGSPLESYLTDTGVKAGIELPSQISVSYYRDISDEIAIMADITWTEWSNFDALVVKFDNLAQPTSTTPENWDDSFRFSIGANYKMDEKTTLRVGVAHDQTPIPSPEDRTARIPGDDRTWLSLGFGYDLDAETRIDVGYSHLFVGDTEINNTDAFNHTLVGEYEADVDILSVQGTFKF